MHFNPLIALTNAQIWALVIAGTIVLLIILWLVFGWRPRNKRRQMAEAEKLFAQERLGTWAHKRMSQWAPDERQAALRYYNGVGRQARIGSVRAEMVPANHHATIAALSRQERSDEQSATRWADLLWLGEKIEKKRSKASTPATASTAPPTSPEASAPQLNLSAKSTEPDESSQVGAEAADMARVDTDNAAADSTEAKGQPDDLLPDRRGSGHTDDLEAAESSDLDAPEMDATTELPASLAEANRTDELPEPEADVVSMAATPTLAAAEDDHSVSDDHSDNEVPEVPEQPATDSDGQASEPAKPSVPAWILDARREINRRSAGTATTETESSATEPAAGDESASTSDLDVENIESVEVVTDTTAAATPETVESLAHEGLLAAEETEAPEVAEAIEITEPAATVDEGMRPKTLADALAMDDVAVDTDLPAEGPIGADAAEDEIEAEIDALNGMAERIEQASTEDLVSADPVESAEDLVAAVPAESAEDLLVGEPTESNGADTDDDDETRVETTEQVVDRAIAHALIADDELRQRIKKLRRRASREHELGVAQQRLADRRLEQGRKKKAKAHYESAKEHLAAAERLSHKAKKLQKKRSQARRTD